VCQGTTLVVPDEPQKESGLSAAAKTNP